MPGKITPVELDKMTADFNALLADVLAIIPHGPRLTMALMMFKLAEQEVLFLAQQNVLVNT